MQWHEEDLYEDIQEFNRKLMGDLIWYNTEKPHRSINKLSPMMYYINVVIKNKKNSLICYGFL